MDLFHFPQPLTTSQFPPTGPPPPPQHAPTAALEIAHKMHLMLSNPTTLAIPSWQSLLSGQHPSLAHGHYHPLLTSSANLPSAFPSLVGHCDRPSLRDNNDMVASNHDGHLPSLSANNSNDNHHHRLLQHHQRRPSVDSGLEPSNGSVTSSVEQLNTNSNSNATMNALTSSSSSTSISSLHHESIATSSSVPTSSYFSANSTTTNSTFLDVHKGKAIRLRVKVLVPVHDHPNVCILFQPINCVLHPLMMSCPKNFHSRTFQKIFELCVCLLSSFPFPVHLFPLFPALCYLFCPKFHPTHQFYCPLHVSCNVQRQ